MTGVDYRSAEIRAALLEISKQHQGVLNPHDVIAAAADPGNVLHDRFEWDDSAAGTAYRLAQAAMLIRRVRLTVMRPGGAGREISLSTTRQYQSRPSMRTKEGGYEPIDALLADENKRRELLAQVLGELTAYRKRYAELSELEPVWLAVDEALTDLRDSSATAPVDEPRPGAAG